jgi:hypothetical protein
MYLISFYIEVMSKFFSAIVMHCLIIIFNNYLRSYLLLFQITFIFIHIEHSSLGFLYRFATYHLVTSFYGQEIFIESKLWYFVLNLRHFVDAFCINSFEIVGTINILIHFISQYNYKSMILTKIPSINH